MAVWNGEPPSGKGGGTRGADRLPPSDQHTRIKHDRERLLDPGNGARQEGRLVHVRAVPQPADQYAWGRFQLHPPVVCDARRRVQRRLELEPCRHLPTTTFPAAVIRPAR
ncbi:hypothetical protein GCM10010359_59780 [Streptomyces morookaense]|nr:hypothetical protein GCM10010359_59780 [Streptomyces morookaense]